MQKATLEALSERLKEEGYKSSYTTEIQDAKAAWEKEMDRLANIEYTGEDFEPEIKAREERTIPEFVKIDRRAYYTNSSSL